MDFLTTAVVCITVTALATRYFDYRKAKVKALADEERHAEFQTVLEELATMREVMADMMLTLHDQGRLSPPPTGTEEGRSLGSAYDE